MIQKNTKAIIILFKS